jgi:glucose/arabinose dehydrogenase
VHIRPRRPLALLGALAISLTLGSAANATTRPAPEAIRTAAAIGGAVTLEPAFALTLTPFRTGLSRPIFATTAGDGTNRVYVVEKAGLIKVLNGNGSYLGTLLDIRDRTSKGSEQGLLGLAFHPDYAQNHRYYVDYTDRSGDTVIVEYRTGASGLTTTSGRRLIVIGQPYANHNGGMLAFGADGYLYIGMGDGGSGGDPGNRAQRNDTLLGKLLRMDVDHHPSYRPYGIPPTNPYVNKAGLDLIFAKGLRNPWRFSFDRETHALWIGETMPLVEYPHSSSGTDNCTVIGGYVYRGSAYPAMAGSYVYADLCSRRIWAVDAGAAAPASGTVVGSAPGTPVSFGETESGELFLVTIDGGVYRVGAS